VNSLEMPASCGPADLRRARVERRVRIVLEDQLGEASHVLAAECGEHEKRGLERACARTGGVELAVHPGRPSERRELLALRRREHPWLALALVRAPARPSFLF
jgi:hypothetical protein